MSAQSANPSVSVAHKSPDADLSRVLLIICAHGSAYHPAANEHVLAISAALKKTAAFADVETIFQAGQTSEWPGPCLNPDAFDHILIVPYMMSDGFLAKEMVKKATTTIEKTGFSKPIIRAPSVGTHPDVATVAIKVATEAAEARQTSPDQLSLVIVAHGSRNAPQSRIAAEVHLKSIKDAACFKEITLAFIEEAPFVADVLKSQQGPAVVVGLFAAPGGHAIVDIAEAMDAAQKDDLINAGPIGLHPKMHDLIRQRAIQAMIS